MILFVDTYLSEIALSPNKKLERFLGEVQDKAYVYRKQSKIDIFRYSLASYASLNWSKVIVRVAGDDRSSIEALVPYIKGLFPNAEVSLTRSDTGSKYVKALDMAGPGDPWIFFSPNNDHPFIHHDTAIFAPLLKAAEHAEQNYDYPVSILFSHFTEAINSIKPEKFLFGYTGDFCEVLDEDAASYTVKYDHLSLLSLQIFRRSHLKKMMVSAGDRRVIRTECLGQYNDYKVPTIVIVPKEECCRHYDAYMHTSFVVKDFISASRVPPLFIPDGFFEGKMKVRYGFDQYDQSYVNINPSKKKYIFDSPEGTDLAIPLEKIPEFWRKRIVELQENIHFTDNQGTQGSPLLLDVINPWRAKSRAEIRLAVIYRRFLYSSIGSFLRKTADIGKNLLRSAILTVKRV
ncbi:hypothetical protein N9D59_06555 [Burkholderiaceae bacterium]|nr:hypothetical protein [Burkholderiaceae bacterium]